jgi:hypothetical protein
VDSADAKPLSFTLNSIEFAAHFKRGKLNAKFKTGSKPMTTCITDYDVQYVALAQNLAVPLITRDHKLRPA